MANIRTFLAVDISQDQSDQAARLVQKLSVCGNSFRWSEPSNMHVTLCFLGDVLETEINQVCSKAKRVAQDFTGFEMQIKGTGAFPSLERPRIIWAGIEQGTEPLIELQSALAEAMNELGFPPEARKFHPHLTLGRIRRARRVDRDFSEQLAKFSTFECGTTFVDELVVYSSFLDRNGPTYTPVSRIPLPS